MKKIIPLLFCLLIAASCSKKEADLKPLDPPYILANLSSMPFYADTILADSYDDLKLKAADNAAITRPEALQANLKENAESYLQHLFIGMASRVYRLGEQKLFVDLIQFTDEVNAYGYYARYRPHGVKFSKIGTESFQVGNSRYMTKADYVVIISSEEQSAKANDVMLELSKKLAIDIIGISAPPPLSLFFPFSGKIHPSLKYYPYEYQGIPGLNQVYTTTYVIGEDSLTLFLAMDTDSLKFRYLNRYAQESGTVVPELKRFEYEKDVSVAFKHPDVGIIVAGMKSQKLIGAIGYTPKKADKLLSGWIKGLQ